MIGLFETTQISLIILPANQQLLKSMFKRVIALLICFCLIFEQAGFAEVAPQYVIPSYLSNPSPVADRFRPIHLRSVDFDPSSNDFQLILDKGDSKHASGEQLNAVSRELFEYFRIGLALPNSMFWVNLRPDSPDHIIDPCLEKTDLGRILLEADLQLKKDLARFTHPDTAEGRQYWNKLYAKAGSIFGFEDLEIPAVTRPWIVPGEIIIRESGRGAFVYKATLKVMLEQDYLRDTSLYNFSDPRHEAINEYSSQLIRDLIIPRLTREVNSSKRYAALRQVYYSLILAQWFKRRSTQDTFDNKDLRGLASKHAWSKDDYYQAYCRSVQQGEYSKAERVNSPAGVTIRQYFSGGMILDSGAADSGSRVLSIPGEKAIPVGVTDFFIEKTIHVPKGKGIRDGGNGQSGHFSIAGVLRLAKAMQFIDFIVPADVSQRELDILGSDLLRALIDKQQRSLFAHIADPAPAAAPRTSNVIRLANAVFLGLFAVLIMKAIGIAASASSLTIPDLGVESPLLDQDQPAHSPGLERHMLAEITEQDMKQITAVVTETAASPQVPMHADEARTGRIIALLEEKDPEIARYIQNKNMAIVYENDNDKLLNAWIGNPFSSGSAWPRYIIVDGYAAEYTDDDLAALMRRKVEDRVMIATKYFESISRPLPDADIGVFLRGNCDERVADALSYASNGADARVTRYLAEHHVQVWIGKTGDPGARSEMISRGNERVLLLNQDIANGYYKKDLSAFNAFVKDELRHQVIADVGGIQTIIDFEELRVDTSSVHYHMNLTQTQESYVNNRDIIIETHRDTELRAALLWLQVVNPELTDFIVENKIPVALTDLNRVYSFAGVYVLSPWDHGWIGIARDAKDPSDAYEVAGILSHEADHSVYLEGFGGNPFSYYLFLHRALFDMEDIELHAYKTQWLDERVFNSIRAEVALGHLPEDPASLTEQDIETIVKIRDSVDSQPLTLQEKAELEQYCYDKWTFGDYGLKKSCGFVALSSLDLLAGMAVVRWARDRKQVPDRVAGQAHQEEKPRDGGSGKDDTVDRLAVLGNRVRVLGISRNNARVKTLATVYATGLESKNDRTRRIIWFRPAEVSVFSREQCIAIVHQLAAASGLVKRRLGISDEDNLEELLWKHYLIIGDQLVVDDGKEGISTVSINTVPQLKLIMDQEQGSSQGSGYFARDSRTPGNLQFTRHNVLLEDIRNILAARRDGGSGDEAGGIDFRALAGAAGQPMPSPAQGMRALAAASTMRDLGECWARIEQQMKSEEMPYGRIKEFIAVCSQREDGKKYLERAAASVVNILRIEEEQALQTQEALQDILACLG